MRKFLVFFALPYLLVTGCNLENETLALFSALLPSETNIYFQNKLTEGPNTNVLLYEYFYNGAGVALADFNGDQLLDIYFTSNMEENKMYLNRGDFKFEDISKISKTQGRSGPWKTGVTAVDINGDRRMDLYVCYSGMLKEEKRRNQLFLNMGNNAEGIPQFTEVAKLYGLDSNAYSNQGYFFDYDRDGDLDMLLLNHNPKSLPVLGVSKTKVLLEEDQPQTGLRLYEQKNRHFYDRTPQTQINGSSLSYGLGLALADFNNDGWTDFYLSNDYTIPDYLYLNNQAGDFVNTLQESMPYTSHFSMGNDSGDINNDGFIDLMTLDMLPEDNKRQKLLQAPDNYNLFNLNIKSGFHAQYMRNMVQLNNGNGTFSEVGQMMGVSNTDWSWAALFADFDNDGWQDLFVSNGYKRDYTNRDFLNYMENFIGEKKSNLKREDVLEIINNMPASNVSNYLFANIKGKEFRDVTAQWGVLDFTNSNGAAYGDLDGDGDLDLVVNNINAPAGIYRNNTDASQHFLQVALKGSKKNSYALGARVTLFTKEGQQTKEQFPTRGYLSTVSPILHFGLGKQEQVDSIVVRWSDGTFTSNKAVGVNQKIELEQRETQSRRIEQNPLKTLFLLEENELNYKHSVKNVLDFDRQKLLHFQPSFTGPALIKGDLNNDQREDLILGGGKGQALEVWIQQADGSFQSKPSQAFVQDREKVTVSIALVDFDLDGDLDIYSANGGYHDFTKNSTELRDVLYLNTGEGHFERAKKTFDLEGSSIAVAGDVNQDGAADLFVAGAIVPGSYPNRYPNRLLRNDGKGNLTTDTEQSAALNTHEGIVRDALWTDLNADGFQDLILVGEWMPITVYLNRNGRLEKQSDYFSHVKTKNGWWNSIQTTDLNKDGRMDFIFGNEGRNNPFNASIEQPVELHFDDFDQNGTVDPILSYYIEGKAYPLATRDELLAQWVALKSIYPSYVSYADTDLEGLLKGHRTKKTQRWEATQMESIVLLSKQEGHDVIVLPDEVQRSPLTSILPLDVNEDGNQDLILAGNRSQNALKLGQNEASYGIVLLGDGSGGFQYVTPLQSGLQIKGSVSALVSINNSLYVARCAASLSTYKRNPNEK
jgi:hypothetical protein